MMLEQMAQVVLLPANLAASLTAWSEAERIDDD